MNKNILKISTLVAIWAFCSQNATAQQGFGTNQPSKASAIEMTSSSKGLLIPRVALTGLNNFDPIKGELGTEAAKVNSLLVYNTATTTGITPGYYYWTTDGTTPNSYWKRLLAGDDAAALNLLGDVTGTLGATTVVKIQGRDVANTAPTSNQVLTWDGSAWTPTSLTPTQITNKATLSVQDGIAITAGSGTDALLGAATIGITDGGIAPVKIQPAAEPRTTRMVMVTQTDGTVTWIPQTDIAPTTTNDLSVTGTELTSTVNGVPATVDLASVVQAAQKTTTVKAGTNTTVTPATPNATGNTEYEVSVATATASALGVVKPGTGLTVDTDGTLNATQATVTNTVTGHKIADVTTSAGTTAINETVTLLSQNATGINYINENGDAGVTAKVVSENANNLIATGTDFGAFLNATTVQNNQLNTVVAQGSGIAVTSSTSGNTTTYTVAAKAISGVEVHDDNVKLGGDLTRVTTITADATNTLAIAGLQPTTDVAKTTDAFVVVGDNGVLKKADIKYSTTEVVTGKKWIGGQVVYERVLEVTLNVEANTITLPTDSRPAKIIGMRMISRTDNSITTELSRYNATTGDMVFGSGPTTQFQKVGIYDLILEYIR